MTKTMMPPKNAEGQDKMALTLELNRRQADCLLEEIENTIDCLEIGSLPLQIFVLREALLEAMKRADWLVEVQGG